MEMCARCHKRVAVVFITRLENGETKNEGICLKCARELGIKPIDDILKKMGITNEEFDQMADSAEDFMQGMVPNEDGENPEDGGAPAVDFGKLMRESGLGGQTAGQNAGNGAAQKAPEGSKTAKRKFLDAYCTSLTGKARRGELDAFEELVRRYEKRVYVIALRSSGNPEDAADITQEVFLRAWRSIENFRGDSGFSTWLFRITMNICVDHARHRQTQPQTTTLTTEDDEERPIHDTAPTPEEQLDNKELGRELAAALAEISEEHRRIVLLRDVSGMSYSEIAEILEISEGTVKSRLARARIALRRILLQRGNILPLAPSNHEKGGETHE